MQLSAQTRPARASGTDYDPGRALRGLSAQTQAQSSRRPYVVGQLGQSLDGRIATPTGMSKYINGVDALRHLHRLRARVDAVVIGVGTAIADDPQLTTRLVPGSNPLRVVIDPQGRMPDRLAMLSDGAGPVLSITTPSAPAPRRAEHLALPSSQAGHIAPADIIAALARRGVRSILVEGGAETLARFLNADAVDELHLMVAPILLGSGKTGLNLAPIEALDEAMRPEVQMMRFGDGDLLCLCDLAAARSSAKVTAAATAVS